MPVAPFRHAVLMREAVRSGVSVEDLARAASYDSGDALAAFDAEAAKGEATSGVFVRHVTRTDGCSFVRPNMHSNFTAKR
jgi:hypothetical protein